MYNNDHDVRPPIIIILSSMKIISILFDKHCNMYYKKDHFVNKISLFTVGVVKEAASSKQIARYLFVHIPE